MAIQAMHMRTVTTNSAHSAANVRFLPKNRRRRVAATAKETERLRIVGIGGGTGLPVLLDGLSGEPGVDLSAIVTVADDGGSSGRLREMYRMPAVGDLRNCLVALSGQGCLLADLFQHRFGVAEELRGHSLGNLIVTALYQRTGSLSKALLFAAQLLSMNGRALASTETELTLCALLDNGVTVRGESQIPAAGRRIIRVWIEPQNPPPAPGVLEAILQSDAIVLAPGSLFTSLLPNLMVDGVVEAIRQSSATKIHVCNLVTQPGETDGFTASDHLAVLVNCLGTGVIDFCLVNTGTKALTGRQRTRGCASVRFDSEAIRHLGVFPAEEDLLARGVAGIRHDPGRLGPAILSITRGALKAPGGARSRSEKIPREVLSPCLEQFAS